MTNLLPHELEGFKEFWTENLITMTKGGFVNNNESYYILSEHDIKDFIQDLTTELLKELKS